MRKLLGITVVLVLAAVPASAQKVYVDYDRTADIDSYSTFAWGETPEASMQDNNPFIHSRIKNAVEYHLTKGGLTEDTADPDLYVTYHGEATEEVSFMTTSVTYGYGYGPGWGWDPYWSGYWGGMGMGTTTTRAYTYTKGTLLVDIWDAKEKQLIWRGSATDTVPENPQKGAKKIENGIEKIVKKWQKMYAKDTTEGR